MWCGSVPEVIKKKKQKKVQNKIKSRSVSSSDKVESIRVSLFARGGCAMLCFCVVPIIVCVVPSPLGVCAFYVVSVVKGERAKFTVRIPSTSLPAVA